MKASNLTRSVLAMGISAAAWADDPTLKHGGDVADPVHQKIPARPSPKRATIVEQSTAAEVQ